MKHLLIDGYGIYDKDGILIRKYNNELSLSQMIESDGYELSEIKNKNIISGKRLITNNPISNLTMKIINNEAYILINKDFEHYLNICFENKIKAAESNDGVTWRVEANGTYIYGTFNINLSTFNILDMTDSEKIEYDNIKKFIDDNSPYVQKLNNDKYIKHLLIKLNTSEITSEINTIITFDDENAVIREKDLDINTTEDKITIKNTLNIDIHRLIVNLNNDVYIKNTMEEFK